MNSIEHLLQNIGLSYTLAKLGSYVIPVLLGFIVWLIVKRLFRSVLIKWLLFLLLVPGVFGLIFLANPIYEGDFSNSARVEKITGELTETRQLYIITIPGCPFCMESIDRMKEFKQDHPEVAIKYLVCSKQEESMKEYRTAANGLFPVELAKDPQNLASLSNGEFPTFILNRSGELQIWSNDSFGVGALDEVVAAMK